MRVINMIGRIDLDRINRFLEHYIFHTERSNFQQKLFEAFVRKRSVSLFQGILLVLIFFLLLTWPIDYIYLDSHRLIRYYSLIRAIFIPFLFLLLLGLEFIARFQRYLFMSMSFVLLSSLLLFGVLFGSLTGVRRPLFYLVIPLPIITVFFEVKFIQRCILTYLIPLVYGCGFLIFYRDYPYLNMLVNLSGSEAVISIMLGHIVYHINRNRFFQDRSLRLQKQQIHQLAERDLMTGLLLRRSFNLRAHEEFFRAQTADSTFSVLMVDLDNFKEINDTFGHLVGDNVLKTVGSIIQEKIRQSDVAGRYGGEEFCLILPETSSRGGFVLAERLRKDLRDRVFEGPDEETFSITCSIGISEYRSGIMSPEQLIMEADRAMYRAKTRGRDNTVISEKVSS